MGFQSLLGVSGIWVGRVVAISYAVEAPEELQVARLVPLCAAEGVSWVVGVGVVERYDGVFALACTTVISKLTTQDN